MREERKKHVIALNANLREFRPAGEGRAFPAFIVPRGTIVLLKYRVISILAYKVLFLSMKSMIFLKKLTAPVKPFSTVGIRWNCCKLAFNSFNVFQWL